MAEVTIKGKGLIKKIEKDTTPESEYLTYIPANGELVCVTDGDSAYLVVGDGSTVVSGCSKLGGKLKLKKDTLVDRYVWNDSEQDWSHTVSTEIESFDDYVYAKVLPFVNTANEPPMHFYSDCSLVVHYDVPENTDDTVVKIYLNNYTEGEGEDIYTELVDVSLTNGFGFNFEPPYEETTIEATIYFYKYVLE